MKALEGNNYCRCDSCKSYLQYSPEDIQKKTIGLLIKETYKYVECPVCKELVEL